MIYAWLKIDRMVKINQQNRFVLIIRSLTIFPSDRCELLIISLMHSGMYDTHCFWMCVCVCVDESSLMTTYKCTCGVSYKQHMQQKTSQCATMPWRSVSYWIKQVVSAFVFQCDLIFNFCWSVSIPQQNEEFCS